MVRLKIMCPLPSKVPLNTAAFFPSSASRWFPMGIQLWPAKSRSECRRIVVPSREFPWFTNWARPASCGAEEMAYSFCGTLGSYQEVSTVPSHKLGIPLAFAVMPAPASSVPRKANTKKIQSDLCFNIMSCSPPGIKIKEHLKKSII